MAPALDSESLFRNKLSPNFKQEVVQLEELPSPDLEQRWALIRRHCQLVVAEWGNEDKAMRSMRARLMAYSKGFPQSKQLREKFQHIASLAQLDEIAVQHLASVEVVAAATAC